MSQEYRPFASYLRFKEILADPMGHLYRAGEFDAGGFIRAVWLRVFDGPGVPADEVIEGLDRARRISQNVQSTSVAAGLDAVVADGVPAIANDYSPSKPLTVVLARAAEERFPVPIDNALLILEKVSLALAATSTLEIDGERVVHGLLHPGLILVTHDGESQVTGFGVAPQLLALVDDAAAIESIHPYLAPEVIRGRSPGRRGDVYSLGAILFHLLTGSALPAAVPDRAEALETGQLDGDEGPLPDDIRGLLQRSLAEQPEQRFSSAADFKKELDRLLYGGSYSPTTFNLALFMDRLFRAEVEAEEREMVAEQKVDISAYLDTAVETQPLMEEVAEVPPATANRRALWIVLGAAAAVAVAVVIGTQLAGRGPSTASMPPTPTAEEVEAQRQVQEDKMRELAEGLVAEMMAEKEQEIRQELSQRQAKINDLQRRLEESERRARQGELSREEARKRQELERQIAAEEEAQRRQEADLAAERERAEEEARTQVEGGGPATAAAPVGNTVTDEPLADGGTDAAPVVADQEAGDRGSVEVPTARPTLEPTVVPTAVPTAPPTVPPTAVPTPESAAAAREAVIRTNDFVEPTEVDTLPVVIKEEAVVWPRSALTSRRQGVVILQATVNADGLVEGVRILRADHDGFGIPQAASDAAMKYRFKPGMKDGVRIKTWATITKPYRFVMR